MDFEKITAFLRAQWPTIVVVVGFVGPAVWKFSQNQYANRLEEANAKIRRLAEGASGITASASTSHPIPNPIPGISPDRSSRGLVHGDWIQVRSENSATYILKMSLTQVGIDVAGTASFTKTMSPADYEQPFDVTGREYSGYVALTFTSAVSSSASIATALVRIADRGATLDGHWAYRSRRRDDVLTESLVLRRQA